ncbi:response regulator [Alsobacter metallidurans]|uniref:Response regulator n=1 Tax=Alsobacter metallidurans TaxID=340221 RepID=A0A917MJI0_9HYPH|nr:response regulator [Alsobacter metallidurans]
MDGASFKVLLVEDEPLIALTLVDMLEELGHRPLEALNGGQALALFGEHSDIDLLITDLGLPDIAGDRLAELLRAKTPLLPVIFATGHTGQGPQPITPKPPTAHLGKPFQVAELESTIERLMTMAARG